LEEAKSDYRKAHENRGVADPDIEHESLRSSLAEVETQLRMARTSQGKLKFQMKYLEAQRDAPTNPSDAGFDDQFFPVLQTMMNEMQTKMINAQTLDGARIKLEAARKEELAMRPLVAKNIYSRLEYDKIVAEIRIHEATVKQADEFKSFREDLQKQYAELKRKAASGKPVRKAVIEDLERVRKEEATIPGTIAVLTEEQTQKKKALADLIVLKRELGEKDDNVKLIWNRVQDFHSQLTDADARSEDLNANDLRHHSAATAGTTPYSTNGPKLGMALLGVSALLFVGYLALFALPQLAAMPPSSPAGIGPKLPRGLIALVPYMQPAKEKLAPWAIEVERTQASPVVQALANRIVQEGVDPGGIVLFSPTQEQLLVASVMGDLGELFTRRGERVLVFDARHSAETPEWAGSSAPTVAATVEGYLEGRAETSKECFVPTNMKGVEYSRADLSTGVTGVLAAHRFRQLVEEMRERYSLVFFVGPPVQLDAGDALLATLAEGMVLVTETSADPVEIHAYLDTLCQQVPARLYGTLSVPKAA